MSFENHTSSEFIEQPAGEYTDGQSFLDNGDTPSVANTQRSAPSVGISRDEMNLAEFPLTVLSTRSNPHVKTLEFSDTIYHRSGKPIQRRWVITGADKFGLPTSSDDEVLLGLVKLSVQNGFKERKVFFTRYELLKSLRWSTEGRSYSRLQNALDRLSGVRIKASNAFFDNESKAHSTRNFGLLDAYEINDGRDANNKESFFIWSEVLFKSFQAGFVKKLDLDFYLSLGSAVTKRLYRYLDKHFWYRSKISINLFTLCHEKLGVSRNYKYQSMLRQQLDPAAEELVQRGFLAEVSYSGKGKATEVHFVSKSRTPRKHSSARPSESGSGESVRHGQPQLATAGKGSTTAGGGTREGLVASSGGTAPQAIGLEERLHALGMGAPHIKILLQRRSPAEHSRMSEVLDYIEERYLKKGAPRRVTNPVGLVYRSLKDPFAFELSGDRASTVAGRETGEGRLSSRSDSRQGMSAEAKNTNADHSHKRQLQEEYAKRQYEQFLAREASRLRAEADDQLLSSIRVEVETALQKMKALIAPERFAKVVEHRVNQQLLKLFAVDSYEDWLKGLQSRSHSSKQSAL